MSKSTCICSQNNNYSGCDHVIITNNFNHVVNLYIGKLSVYTHNQRFCEAKMVHSLSKLYNYFNIVPIPTNRWIHIYYVKLYLILLIHKVI